MSVIGWLVAGGFIGSLMGVVVMFVGGDVNGAPLTFSVLGISLLGAIALLSNANHRVRGARWMGRIRSVNLDQV